MSLTPEDKLMVLQRFVDNFSNDLTTALAVFSDPSSPRDAKRLLAGALNYALDKLDMYPDHNKGIGVADDAIVLRLAAKLARNAGAAHPALERLALDANNVIMVFEELAGPLERLVATYPDREVRGRTADAIIDNASTRAVFEADIGRESKAQKAHPIGVGSTPDRAIEELRKNLAAAVKRAGLA